MSSRDERFVVLGLAPVRRDWFRNVGRWSNEAVIPVDFIKCISATEVTSRLQSGRPVSALLVDASSPGLDRDMLDLAATAGCAAIVVDHGLVDRDWRELGAAAVLPERFDGHDLVDTLERASQPVGRTTTAAIIALDEPKRATTTGRIVSVTGAGGIGCSTLAMGVAQGLAQRPEHGSVLLADMALRSNQALLHDARDVVPGLTELVDGHRLGTPDDSEIGRTIHALPDRGYHLLLGLRSERDWVSVGARALGATWISLHRLYDTVVVDVTGDFDGAEQTGSNDLEDRNRLSRVAAHRSDLVIAVGSPGTWGVNHVVRTILALIEIGVPPERVLPCINRGPRQPRSRADITAAIGELLDSRVPDAQRVASPVFVPDRRSVEQALRDGMPLPSGVCEALVGVVAALLDQNLDDEPNEVEQDSVTPGSLDTRSVDD